MNGGTVKVQKKGQYANLGNDKVDGHLLAGKKIEDLRVGEERPLLKTVELSNSIAARKAELGL